MNVLKILAVVVIITISVLLFLVLSRTPQNVIRSLIKSNTPPFDASNVSPRTMEGLKHLNEGNLSKYFTPAQVKFIKTITQGKRSETGKSLSPSQLKSIRTLLKTSYPSLNQSCADVFATRLFNNKTLSIFRRCLNSSKSYAAVSDIINILTFHPYTLSFNDTELLCTIPSVGYTHSFTRDYEIVFSKNPRYFNARVDWFGSGNAVFFVSSNVYLSNCSPYNISTTSAYCVECDKYVFSSVCPGIKPFNCENCLNNSFPASLNYSACRGDGFVAGWLKVNGSYAGLIMKGDTSLFPSLFNALYQACSK